jgi:hypothetical protein
MPEQPAAVKPRGLTPPAPPIEPAKPKVEPTKQEQAPPSAAEPVDSFPKVWRVSEDFNAMIGMQFQRFRKGQILTDYSLIQKLNGQPIAPAESGMYAVCPQCKNHFSVSKA